MTRIYSSVQLKLEHNIEQHVPGEFDDKEWEKRREEKARGRKRGGEKRRRRIKTLRTFKANLPSSIADSTFLFPTKFSQQHDDSSSFSTLELRNLNSYLRRTKTLTGWLDAAARVAFMTLFSSCHQLLDYFY